MLYGTTPFKGANRHQTFSNVLRNEVSFPDQPGLTSVCKSVIKKLLNKDEHKRLGSQSGASEVKQHKWFQPINWGLLRHSKPPIVPATSNGVDTINFRPLRESKSLDLDGQIKAVAGSRTAHHGESADDSVVPDPFSDFTSITRSHDGDL